MEKWNEIRTGYIVAKLGTISAAAHHLGTHRATVIRHIDTLEKELGAKIFMRHAKGYTPTDFGQDLLRVASKSEDQINQFFARSQVKPQVLEGELILTSLDLVADQVLRLAQRFQDRHPKVHVRFVTTKDLLRLEYGDAHIAFRILTRATNPDYVVRPFKTLRFAPYAHKTYLKSHGVPKTPSDYEHHKFLGVNMSTDPSLISKWLRKYVPPKNIVFQGNDVFAALAALEAGMGIGFLPITLAHSRPDLVQIMPPRRLWDMKMSVVTHVHLNRTAKVQAFLEILKELS